MRSLLALLMSLGLAACASSPPVVLDAPPPIRSNTPPPQRPAPVVVAPTTGGFVAPEVMRLPGLENVIGLSAAELERNFGEPRLDVKEGDARKLLFSGENCVLDVFLYPLTPGAAPSATHVEARRKSDGHAVDRAACARALRKR